MLNRPYLLLTLAPLIWAGNTIAGKLAAPEVSPMILTLMRWAIACSVLLPFAIPSIKREWRTIRVHLPLLFVYGAMGFTAFNLLLYAALNHTSAINVSIVQAAIPMIILLLNLVFFRQRIFILQLLGVVLAFLGVAITATKGDIINTISQGINQGDTLMLIACVLYAAYSIILRFKPHISWMSFIFVLAVCALMVAIPFALYESQHGGFLHINGRSVLILVYIAIFPSIVAQLCYAKGVELIGASRAGFAINLIPIFGAMLSVIILGEAFRWYHGIGLLLVLCGIAFSEGISRWTEKNQ
ncbi:DMT family transporter [Ostreibacterium oceani]|uniref:EamA family transporter n=1 Tax=Ostreibacterium oceani TaxID=2654998 RepID=A0A6N7EVB0_9GAMM|nr:DMT family transporter [Ostreibacterium oceani]MPV86402.1 EamA family transporter [Ostreibacterium oceani]